MGQIYARAKMVLMWLGHDEKVQFAVKALHNCKDKIIPFDENYRTLIDLEYWSRAWIVQEVVLAKQPAIFLESGVYDFIHLSGNMDLQIDLDDEWQASSRLVSFLTTAYSSDLAGSHKTLRGNVLHVLSSLGNSKKCSDTRDRYTRFWLSQPAKTISGLITKFLLPSLRIEFLQPVKSLFAFVAHLSYSGLWSGPSNPPHT
jgi:hypothetical protein